MRQRSLAACIRGHANRASDLSKRNEVAMHPTLSQDRLTLEVLRAEVLKIEEIAF